MKKLLGLLAAFGLTASAGSAVVACGNVDNEKSEMDTVKEAINALTASSKTEPFADQAAAEAAVVALATEKVAVEIKAEAGEGTFAVVLTIVDGEATKEITLNVLLTEIKEEVTEKTDIATLITTLALGEFDEEPTKDVLLAKVTALNAGFTADMHALVDVVITAGASATITAKADDETIEGNVTVTFTVKATGGEDQESGQEA
ncbi:lipoprotein [Spiroplasma alleghenense]|uniref:Spiralin n=1 Tax=Spiroplasma alleghenense TaxID=216931 RepID=A0A345Z3P9_9MOLU|nr:lipoprotein [Spiroplasma alleghenense]AXK51228.1 hypothetical protein SALLE_v1c05540 [Spiroplasma alleghenense]